MPRPTFSARIAAATALALSVSPLAAQAPPLAPPEGEESILDVGLDRADRMTVPVSIEGQGPFQFVIDTGAERTVIARELATSLNLESAGSARVHSMSEVSDLPTVLIPGLEVGGKQVGRIRAPALRQRNMGAQGMLGVDSLKSQRVSFDFGRREMTVVPSRRPEERWDDDTIVIVGRSRFGRLVLVDASLDGEKVWVIIDTGSEVTIANSALRRKLERGGRLGPVHPVELISVTGGRVIADQTTTKTMRLGGVNINNMPLAFADVHPFKSLDLMDRPAILLGMDALRAFDKVSVDFANRKVRMLAREPV
jgi:predicted aspartyl protease